MSASGYTARHRDESLIAESRSSDEDWWAQMTPFGRYAGKHRQEGAR